MEVSGRDQFEGLPKTLTLNDAEIREAMAEFGLTRSGALSYAFNLNKDHGIGYSVVGDALTLILPKGCKNPWEKNPF